MGNAEKMKEFINKFLESDTVTKECGDVSNFKAWLQDFKLDAMPQKAIDELVEMVGAAEERSKIALIDLMRLLFQFEGSAAHILYKHWETFDLSIF